MAESEINALSSGATGVKALRITCGVLLCSKCIIYADNIPIAKLVGDYIFRKRKDAAELGHTSCTNDDCAYQPQTDCPAADGCGGFTEREDAK